MAIGQVTGNKNDNAVGLETLKMDLKQLQDCDVNQISFLVTLLNFPLFSLIAFDRGKLSLVRSVKLSSDVWNKIALLDQIVSRRVGNDLHL